MALVTSTNIDYLLPLLRLRIGDTTVGQYRYTDDWLNTALVAAVWALQRRWTRKYLTTDDYATGTFTVTRNTDEWTYAYADPPIIQAMDVNPIIVQAALIVLEGSLESYSWHLGSWRDAEIYYSNIESGRTKGKLLKSLMEELDYLLPPPNKRLKNSLKGSLVGYKGNVHESAVDY